MEENDNSLSGEALELAVASFFSSRDPKPVHLDAIRAVTGDSGASFEETSSSIHPDGRQGKADASVEALASMSDGSLEAFSFTLSIKHASGKGSSNQILRTWAADAMGPESDDPSGPELRKEAAEALRMMCGSLSSGDRRNGLSVRPAADCSALGKSQSGTSLQGALSMWLGDHAERLLRLALAGDGARPVSHVWITHSMIDSKRDLHIMVPVESIVAFSMEGIREECRGRSTRGRNRSGLACIPCPGEASFSIGPAVRIKRKGGDGGAPEADQLQITISPPAILSAVVSGKLEGAFAAAIPSGSDGVFLLSKAWERRMALADEESPFKSFKSVLQREAARAILSNRSVVFRSGKPVPTPF